MQITGTNVIGAGSTGSVSVAEELASLRLQLAEAVAAERERAARVCERLAMSWQNLSAAQSMLNEAAAEIRKG